jgi:hypothetical protein
MTLAEYAALDAVGLADAIARRQLSAKEASKPTPIGSTVSTSERSATARSAACRS